MSHPSSSGLRRPVPFLLAAAVALVAGVPGLRAFAAGPRPVAKLTWFGQACFLLESASGTQILMDPISKGLGYELPSGLRADAVTVSHEHPDHNNVGLLANKPKILRGLTADRKGWVRVNEKVKDISIRSVGVYHDETQGSERGLNTVFIFEVGGIRLAHLGDLGHALSDAQLSAIGAVDVLLVPVGGTFTVDALGATRVVEQLRPRLLVVPMHYRTAALNKNLPLATADEFLVDKRVRREKGNTFAITGVKSGSSLEVVVLDYK